MSIQLVRSLPLFADLTYMIPGNEMTFCTVAAKEALLREFEKIEHRHYHDFILEKQVEREAIMAASLFTFLT